MDQFPILVEHGPLIWRAIQIVFVAAVIAAIWAIRWWMARTAQRAALRRLRIDHGAIRGVLRGGGATTVSVESVGPSLKHGVASWRPDTLRLETADRTIELVGEVRVIGGSRFDARRRRLPRLACRDAIVEALPWSTGRIHGAVALHLAPGDEIEVRGTPQPSAGRGEATPRDADIAWSMRGDDAALELSAIRPVISRLPLGIVRTAIVALVSFGASVGVLRSCGEDWESECRHLAHDGGRFIELDNGHACVLAASTPKLRDRGLQELFTYLDEDPYRDEPTMRRLDALARETVGCDRLPHLLGERRYDTALAEARRCGDLRVEHEALVALGYFAEAAALRVPATEHEPALPILTTLIAASRWTEAATALRAHQNKDDCLADWFAQLGGDAAAAKRVSSEADCARLRAELDPAPDRSVSSLWLQEPEAMLVRPESAYDALELWLPIPEQPGLVNRAIRLRQRAVKQVLDNDTDGALATAREVEELSLQILDRNAPDDYAFTLRPSAVLSPAIQLYTPVVFDGIATRLAVSEQRMMDSSKRITGETDPQWAASLRELNQIRYPRLFARSAEPLTPERVKSLDEISVAAREGKLERVMAIVQDRRYASWNLVDLIAVIPHIPSLYTRLARELPYLGRSSFRSSSPASHALDAFVHRELLEAVGATAAAGHWDAIYRRYDAVLRDPTHARALALRRYY